jgi:hypothetical protein
MSRIGKKIIQGLEELTTELETTTDQWREALTTPVLTTETGWNTTSELALNHGLHRSTVIIHIAKLLRDGSCVKKFAKRPDSRGRLQTVPVYKLTEK